MFEYEQTGRVTQLLINFSYFFQLHVTALCLMIFR